MRPSIIQTCIKLWEGSSLQTVAVCRLLLILYIVDLYAHQNRPVMLPLTDSIFSGYSSSNLGGDEAKCVDRRDGSDGSEDSDDSDG